MDSMFEKYVEAAEKMRKGRKIVTDEPDKAKVDALVNDHGFTRKQATELAKRGVTAAMVQRLCETTENDELDTTDGIYKFYVGKMSEKALARGKESYKRGMQKE